MTTVREIAWLAGWLEGEGSFVVSVRSPRISATSTDRDILDRVVAITTGVYYTRPDDPRCSKPAWGFHVGGQRAIEWMMTLYPLMGVRRRQQIRTAIVAWRMQRKPGPALGSHHRKAA